MALGRERKGRTLIRVLVADDHLVVRRGLKHILGQTHDIVVSAEASSAEEVRQRLGEGSVDLVVLDISMPDENGIELLKDLKRLYPKLPVLMLSVHSEQQYAVRALRAGAAGYLTKDSAADELVAAVRKSVAGGRYLTAAIAEKVAATLGENPDVLPHERLSDREFQVLVLIGSGKTITEIAEQLQLSVKTVSTYRTRLLEKMSLGSTAELMRYAITHQLV